MGDRIQRAQGKAKELKAHANREAGIAADKSATEVRGAGEELKGKVAPKPTRASTTPLRVEA